MTYDAVSLRHNSLGMRFVEITFRNARFDARASSSFYRHVAFLFEDNNLGTPSQYGRWTLSSTAFLVFNSPHISLKKRKGTLSVLFF